MPFQQAVARRGILRTGLRASENRNASSSGLADGSPGGPSPEGWPAEHRLRGHRKQTSREDSVVTCPLYNRRVY
jgi:hypothetical protein